MTFASRLSRLALIGSLACGLSCSDTSRGAANTHRPEEVLCSPPLTDAATLSTDGATDPNVSARACTQDSDCVGCTNGQGGRCEVLIETCVCDQCLRDEDCGASGVCACDGQTFGFSHTTRGNVCVPSNCRVDADCGRFAFCSPTVDLTAGTFYGVAGYYCHTVNDQCTNDADCTQGDCRYAPQVGFWVCATGGAAG